MDNYILAYYQGLKDGTQAAGHWVHAWYQMIVGKMESGEYIFDAKKAGKAIRFIENFCRHHEGRLAPEMIRLELWQKALLSVIFGIMDSNGDRRFREVVIVIGRKNGKTLLAAAIACYCAYMDGEYGARIYFAAPKLEQAGLCFDAAYQMILKEPELAEMAKKRRSDIYIAESNTSMKPLAFSAKKSDGLNISLGVCDEMASWAGDQGMKFYEVLKSSLGARRQPILMTISTAGYVNDGAFDELIMRCTSVLMGGSKETRLAPFLYTIDHIDRWNDINEIRKANPNLGVSVSVDYMLEEINIAEGSLSKKAEFLTKYCNIKQNSSQAWLSAEAVNKAGMRDFTIEDLRHSYCVGGIDLSRTTDLTSCCAVIEKDGELYVLSQFFMPAERIDAASAEDKMPYRKYIEQGILTASGDNFVDYHDCVLWFVKLMKEYEILPLVIGYDRYSAQYMVEELKGIGMKMDDVYQGYNLTPVLNEFEGSIKDGTIHIGGNNLLKAHLLNSALKRDIETSKVKLIKMESRQRIDGTAALMDAMTVRQKWYSEIGAQLQNKRSA
mgnify:CR=1 FL=1